jgi:hypothetical protein
MCKAKPFLLKYQFIAQNLIALRGKFIDRFQMKTGHIPDCKIIMITNQSPQEQTMKLNWKRKTRD